MPHHVSAPPKCRTVSPRTPPCSARVQWVFSAVNITKARWLPFIPNDDAKAKK
jgi:hypothetical protein